MREILITSSVLIAVIALVRTLLKRRLSPTYRYFLWLLVALRLFIPITLFPSPVSVLNGVTDIKQTIVTTKVPIVPVSPQAPTTISPPGTGGTGTGGARPNTPAAPNPPAVSIAPPDVDAVLHVLWLSGVGVMAIWFLTSDVRFRRRLRRTRKAVEGVDCPLPVYVTEAVPSPCLYGLFRPAIYLTPHCLEREETLRHVLTHESTHFRHGDHIWSLARCICLAIYWFNPLVWLAAVLSRQDGELACDEDAIRALGEGERAPYGRTLLSMVVPKVTAGDFLRTATTMTSGKKELRERITFIAKKPKQALLALAVAALVVGVAVSCTFTGAEVSKKPDVPIAEALTVLPEELKDSVVLKEDGEAEVGELLAAYYYQEDVDAGYDGWMCSVARLTPVEFEQSYYGFNETGGGSYLGRDGDWYYVLYRPSDVRTAHYETYGPAVEAVQKWVEDVFALYEDIKPMEEDVVYMAFTGPYSYDSPHANVIYHPYYGLTNYGAERTDTAYTLLLSQPAKQGTGGIWCVDRWYDGSGIAYMWIPETDMTLEAYYADLQAKAEAGEASWALDPLEVCVKYVKTHFDHDRAPEAFQVGEIYEGEPDIENTAVTLKEGVKRRLDGILSGPSNGTFIALVGANGVNHSTRALLLDPQARNGPGYTARMVEDYTWKDVAEAAYFNGGTLEPETYGWKVRLYNEEVGEFTVYQGSDIVRYDNLSSGTSWYETVPKGDTRGIATLIRDWYDEVEYMTYTDPQVEDQAGGMSFEQVAWMYTESVAAGMREISPDSSYALEDAKAYKAEVYDTIEGDDTQFCFNMLVALKHSDIGTVGHYQAGAGTTPIEEPGFEGYHSAGTQVALRREGNIWRCVSSGSGGVSLARLQAEVSKELAVAQEVQGRLEEMLGEAGKLNVGLGYSTPQGGGRRLLDAKKEDGAYYVDKMLDYTWEVLPAGILWEPEKYDYDVEIRNHMVGELNFYGDSDIVRFLRGDNAVWYRATPMSADTQNIAALMREWYDDTLHNDSEMYDPLYIEEVGATLLLPKSWAGNYVLEKTPGESGFYLAQKDFLAGEWGTRADGTEGPIPDPEGGLVSLIGFDVQEKEDYLATFGHIGGHNGLWLGERDGLYYLIWFPTSFSSGDTVNAEEKAALYNKLMDDIVAYPGDASDYFIFDP